MFLNKGGKSPWEDRATANGDTARQINPNFHAVFISDTVIKMNVLKYFKILARLLGFGNNGCKCVENSPV